jgi:predicted amidohydrolase
MQVRACQLGADMGDATARLAAIRWLIIDAASDGADVIVLPELALTGYGAGAVIRDEAETVDGPVASELRRLADEHGITVIAGMALNHKEALINAALIARPSQAPIVYAKQHLYAEYEKTMFSAGSAPCELFEVGGMKAGVVICFDVEFPERVRELAKAGAQVIFVPTALPASGSARMVAEYVVPTRAFESQVFIVYVDHAGTDARFTYQGLSCIAAPDGSRIAVAPEDAPQIMSATLDPADYVQSIAANPYLAELALHRRP